MEFLHQASFRIGVHGVLVVCHGVVGNLVRFVRSNIWAAGGCDLGADRSRLRHLPGYCLLLGFKVLNVELKSKKREAK